MSYLSLDELGWLLGLATQQRKKRERSLERMRRKADQSLTDFEQARDRVRSSLAWAVKVEDHLIRLVGDLDASRLRQHQRERYEGMRALHVAASLLGR